MRAYEIVWVVASTIVTAACASAGGPTQESEGQARQLMLHPARPTAGSTEAQLLPAPDELVDGDAFALYEKAVRSLPQELDWAEIKEWRKAPLDQLARGEVEAALLPLDACLPWLEQAGKCRRCNWPLDFEGSASANLQTYRNLVFLLSLKARSQLAHSDCASCVRTLGTGFSLARHFGIGPTIIHLLVGSAVSAVMCGEMELYIQQPDAASLATALRAIPKPLFDEEHSELYGMDEASRNRIRLLLRRANRHVIALQYIETLRLYPVGAGKWPETLDKLEANLPDDPVTGRPFAYTRLTETRAILEGPRPEGGDAAKDVIRYQLNLVKE